MEQFRQFFFVPSPPMTEANSPDQTGRVFVITGGYSGVGFELAQILYGLNATIYLCGRSDDKAEAAISRIKVAKPKSSGRLDKLIVDLQDFPTIKLGVEKLLAKESRLDVLVNNAGVMFPPEGSKDAQGNELHIGLNCLGSCLLYKLLEPQLARTAAASSTGSVRVTWAGSVAIDVTSPKPHGIIMDESGRPIDCGVDGNYGASKVGNLFLANEFSRRSTRQNGIVHACFNPGNLRTDLFRHWRGFGATFTDWCLVYPPINGGYTELYAALSPDITVQNSGVYVLPWGRLGSFRADIQAALEPAGGAPGSGNAAKFVDWCEREVQKYM